MHCACSSRITPLTNRGFIELHNTQGFFMIGFGFLLVTMIVLVGGILFKVMAHEDTQKRKAMKAKLEEEKKL